MRTADRAVEDSASLCPLSGGRLGGLGRCPLCLQTVTWTVSTSEETQSHCAGKLTTDQLMTYCEQSHCLTLQLSVHMSACLSTCLSVCVSTCLSVCVSICLCLHMSVCVSTYLSFSVTWRSSVGVGGVSSFSLVRCVSVLVVPGVHTSSSTAPDLTRGHLRSGRYRCVT